MARYVRIENVSAETGSTPKAARLKIETGAPALRHPPIHAQRQKVRRQAGEQGVVPDDVGQGHAASQTRRGGRMLSHPFGEVKLSCCW